VSEAAFLWLLRDSAVSKPHISLGDLAKLDTRIDAHVDGVRIAAEEGRTIVREALASRESGDAFVGAMLAFEDADEVRIQEVLTAALSEQSLSRAITSALGWISFQRASSQIRSLLSKAAPVCRRVGLGGASIRRSDPGPPLQKATLDQDLPLRTRALRAVGELGRLDLLPTVEGQLKADDSEVRFSAAWSTAVLSSNPEALSALATIALYDCRNRERALQAVMRRADPHAAKIWQRKLAQDSATLRLAVQGAGAIGDPELIPWLIEQMKTPELARVAGESFTTITGVDIAYQDLEGERPEGFESGPTEDPADENVEMDADENLPWPDPTLIEKWWQSCRSGFQPGTRHLLGKPITIDWCKHVLRVGRQRQRAAAALELAMRQPGTPLFEVRAPGFRQKQLLGV